MRLIIVILLGIPPHIFSQQLQLHYDLRHTLDPKHNPKNFPMIVFEYFKSQDSGTSLIKPGSFLLKAQADLIGAKNNIGKYYMEVSQSFRCWKPKIFVQLQYSGGLGIAEPGSYGFYISNAFSLGLSHPFQWQDAWFNVHACYTYHNFKKPSHDLLTSFYWWKGVMNYKLQFAGDVELWTVNRNQGDSYTAGTNGKKISFYGEPQIWYKIKGGFSFGSRVNLYYHVLTNDNSFQVYPTIGLRYQFKS
ncbi:MAG: DUF5020 family protein [Bacteroidetes bacterium]|nr:MAG: DUF5020 family protein [Bacteroidota bacterium]